MRLYLHQIFQGQPTHNQVAGYGTLVIADWTVIDAIQPNANIIARTKGLQVQASIGISSSWFNYFSMVFQNAR
jgi:hypothetical protein